MVGSESVIVAKRGWIVCPTHSSLFDGILGFFGSDDDLLFLPILVVEGDGEDVQAFPVRLTYT